jgi:hypothetical protein
MAPDRTLLGVYIDRDLHRRFKQRCEANGITLSFTVEQLLRRFLAWQGLDVRLLKETEVTQDN